MRPELHSPYIYGHFFMNFIFNRNCVMVHFIDVHGTMPNYRRYAITTMFVVYIPTMYIKKI